MSKVPMPGAWVDPWSWTLVDKTPEMFWGNLILDQVSCWCMALLEGGHAHIRDVSQMQHLFIVLKMRLNCYSN
jgi:hypothetical protein